MTSEEIAGYGKKHEKAAEDLADIVAKSPEMIAPALKRIRVLFRRADDPILLLVYAAALSGMSGVVTSLVKKGQWPPEG